MNNIFIIINHNITNTINYYFNPKPRKVLFDHIPKCAGSSLNEYLRSQYPKWKIFTINGVSPQKSIAEFKSFPRQRRKSFALINGHLANELFEDVDPECLKITVLREPVDRIVSHYYYAKMHKDHYLHERINREGISLDGYVSLDFSDELRNWYVTHFSGLPLNLAESNPEESVGKAVENIMERYDLIGFLEEFQSFTDKLCEMAGYSKKYENKKVNVNRSRPAWGQIPEKTRNKIAKVNYLDIDFYQRVKEKLG